MKSVFVQVKNVRNMIVSTNGLSLRFLERFKDLYLSHLSSMKGFLINKKTSKNLEGQMKRFYLLWACFFFFSCLVDSLVYIL